MRLLDKLSFTDGIRDKYLAFSKRNVRFTESFEYSIFFVLTIVFWELATRLLDIRPAILPAPSNIVVALIEEWNLFLYHGWSTFEAVIIGLVIGTAIGMSIGIVTFYSSILQKTFYPFIISIAIAPKIAFAPILVVWFGSGLKSTVSLAVLMVFFPMMVNTFTGLQQIDKDMLAMAESYGVGEWFLFWKIRLPSAAPYLISGIKLAVVFAVIGAVVAEFVASSKGIGYLIVDFSSFAQTSGAFAAIVTIAIMSFLLYGTAEYFSRRYFFWDHEA